MGLPESHNVILGGPIDFFRLAGTTKLYNKSN
jgi:hypothetical protein